MGFHTDMYRENFLRACQYLLPEVSVEGDAVRLPDGRSVRSSTHPISVDARELTTKIEEPRVQRQTQRLREQLGPRVQRRPP